MKTTTIRSTRLVAVATLASLALGGCATNNPRDPLEPFNRGVFAFNDTVDKYALKPVATVYKNVLPSFLQTGVHNFFGNLTDAWSGVNNMLQGKGQAGMQDFTRFAMNSTFGLVGVLDIATPAGLPKHNEDLGQTLGHWGVPPGPYLVLPLLGSSTVRDTAALPGDWYGDLWTHKRPNNVRNIGTAVKAVDVRATYLDASDLVEGAALDRYEFLRDGYLQRRESQVTDGGRQSAADSASGKLDMKAAYGDDAGAAAKPATPAAPATDTPVTPVTPAEPMPATPAPVTK